MTCMLEARWPEAGVEQEGAGGEVSKTGGTREGRALQARARTALFTLSELEQSRAEHRPAFLVRRVPLVAMLRTNCRGEAVGQRCSLQRRCEGTQAQEVGVAATFQVFPR